MVVTNIWQSYIRWLHKAQFSWRYPSIPNIKTTGSGLVQGGVAEVKSHPEQLENSEGGVYLVDEAYQLTEGHNYGGNLNVKLFTVELTSLCR